MSRPDLFLLHFAGGNSYSFNRLTPWLQDFNVRTPELPGRGRRIREPLLKDFDEAALDIYQQVKQGLTGNRYLIYGHSMGAYLAVRVAGLLEKEGIFPAGVIVSGNAGPGIRDGRKRYLLPLPDFIKELELLGGIPREVMDNEELLEFFEPIIRADFEIAEENGMDHEPPVRASLYALMGSLEENTDRISNWGRFTTGSFSHEILEGDHFFINDHPKYISEIIRGRLTDAGVLHPPLITK